MTNSHSSRLARTLRGITFAGALIALPAFAAGGAPRVFPQPEEAAAALVDSLKAADGKAVLAVLGGKARDWVFTGDRPTDIKVWQSFVEAYDAQHTVVEVADGRAVLIVGPGRYPFSFPIMRVAGGWRFDAEQGKEELINRRVGMNELSTIEVLKEVVAAQREYALMDRNGNGSPEYAARFTSSEGKRDGLYWQTAEGEAPSPLGPLVADAQAEGYGKHARGAPFHGYLFKMLTGQGPDAVGGAQTYTVNGLVGGFAVLAYPAKYGLSGVKSFIVNQNGVILEKDLGANTAAIAAKTTLFNPDKGWTPVAKR
ncbi:MULTISPECIES: DUF2950 domain-containing protein [Niveibacterium]|uniref:DUF2950 domain-containing protein n=1 Tax=Niveibacterium microcysteis TaxID=2811415 RepID=A0ABX7M6D6_9RHOO|nr:DUF2950 domain-containing protein [Niveibacterium microcysteis]QSI77316.1 DUF2950 domain-containing protein [Niveibacterium microcysteis]